jgi:quercetin dioxygenase-like cupin family protein
VPALPVPEREMSDGYTILTLDEIDTAAQRENTTLIPIRHHLGFRAAGVNAWKADTGGRLIPPHEEDSGNEELYVVVSGRARFTVGEEEADAAAGTLVFVPAELFRTAVAAEDRTIVLVVGATVAEAFYGGGWDSFALADAYRQAGRPDESRAILEQQIVERPDHWGPQYNAACLEALGGNADAAIEHLRRAKELDTEGESAQYFRDDSDLDSLRDDPRFRELLG